MLPNPILDLIVRFPAGGGSPQIEAGISAGLLSVLQRPRRTSAADDRLRSAVMEAVVVSLDVAADCQVQYVAVQALDELEPLLRERRVLLERSIDLARSRFEFGEVARLDVITLEARAVELELEISRSEADRGAARIGLARRIGQPSDGATWTLDAFAALPEVVEDEFRWIALALERRPELQARRFELAALGDDRSAIGSTVLEGSNIGLDAQRDNGWSVGPAVSVPLPLFDTGRARKDRADAAIITARHGLVMAQRAVVEDVRRAYTSYRSARSDLLRVRSELLPLQRLRRAQVEALYDAKEVDLTSVLLAEQDLRAAETASIQLEQQAAVSLLRLQRAVGGAVVARALEESPDGSRHETPRNEMGDQP